MRANASFESPGSQDDGAAITAPTARSSDIPLGRSERAEIASRQSRLPTFAVHSRASRSDTCRLTQIILMFARLQAARPRTVNFITGGVVMAVGDAGTQRFVEGATSLDGTRTAICSGFNASVSVPLSIWYTYADKIWPQAFLTKVIVNQILSSLTLSPGFVAWSNCFEALLQGQSLSAASELTIDTLKREAPSLVATSFCVWLPTNSLMFWLVPNAYRIAFMSSISTVWGGYCSFVAHRGEPPV